MKKLLKKVSALVLAVTLVLSTNTFAYAAEDIVLDGDDGASTFIKEWSAKGGDYKYLGFVTLKEATSEYTKLQLTYKGDITYLRIEFNREADDSNEGPYWFNQDQELHFIVSDGKLDLNPSSYNTVTFDLAAMGINIEEFWGMHLHYLDPEMNEGSFTIKDARLIADGSEPASYIEGNGSNGGSGKGNSGSGNSGTSGSSGSSDKKVSASGGTEGTAGGSTDAPSTGSAVYPIAIACGGAAVAVVAFFGSNVIYRKKKQ